MLFSAISNDKQRNELETFYKENVYCFLNVARVILHNKIDAEDAVQQAFSEIADKPERFFDIPASRRINYVFTIVKNISIEMFNKKNKISLDDFAGDIPNETEFSLEDDIIGKISESKLKSFIDKLPPLQKNVLILRCLNGMSTSETAQALNVSQSAVKERLRLARKAIQEYVIKEEELYE